MSQESLDRLDRAPAVALPTALLYAPAAVALLGGGRTLVWFLAVLFSAIALACAIVFARSIRGGQTARVNGADDVAPAHRGHHLIPSGAGRYGGAPTAR